MAPAGATKAQLFNQLCAVYIERGYDGATLTHLAHASELSKASLYHHFPGGKPEMAAVLVRHTIGILHQEVFTLLGKAVAKPANATKRLHEFIDAYANYVEQGEKPCLLCVLVQHTNANNDLASLHVLIAEQNADWLVNLSAALESAGLKAKRARREAHNLMNTLYGAQITAKMLGKPEVFADLIKQLHKALDRLL